MTETISPARSLRGIVTVPGDKSISHRFAMLTSIAEGESLIYNYSTGADCQSTLACMQALGSSHEFREIEGQRVLAVQGSGINGLREATSQLDAGNSGSTIRMLSGILAGQPFTTKIAGDSSLAKRPMRRVISPLSQMGAQIEAQEGQFPPLTIHGSRLKAIDYQLPVASAQVKSCVLLAGLYADGETVVREPITTRDHTEIALRELGADVTLEPRVVKVRGGANLIAKSLVVPGDLSSAAFFLIGALILPGSEIVLTNVGLNPTRTALLDVLRFMGANIKLLHIQQVNGEIIGNLEIRSSPMKGGTIEGATTAAVIDELPILSVLGALSENGLVIRDASELRVKETDRISAIEENLGRMGVACKSTESTLEIPGRQKLRGATIDSFGDHRIAMAFAIAALAAEGQTEIESAEAAAVSFPEFFTILKEIAQ